MDDGTLQLFCTRVARTDRIGMTIGYPANVFDLRQYLNARSETYFLRVWQIVDGALTDPELKVSNRQNLERWRRVMSARLVGAEAAALTRMIETLQLERLLIEHATATSAFRFGLGHELIAGPLPGRSLADPRLT